MTRITKVFLFVAALSFWWVTSAQAVPVQGTEPAIHVGAPPAAETPHWQTFTSAEGRFSVLLPSRPESKAVVLPTVNETLQQFICRDYTGVYLIQYVDRSAKDVQLLGAEKVLSLADDAFINRNQGSAITKRRFVLGSYLGHEIIANRSNGNRESHSVYLVGTRRYTLITLQRRDQVEADPDASAKFLNSFTVPAAKMPIRNR